MLVKVAFELLLSLPCPHHAFTSPALLCLSVGIGNKPSLVYLYPMSSMRHKHRKPGYCRDVRMTWSWSEINSWKDVSIQRNFSPPLLLGRGTIANSGSCGVALKGVKLPDVWLVFSSTVKQLKQNYYLAKYGFKKTARIPLEIISAGTVHETLLNILRNKNISWDLFIYLFIFVLKLHSFKINMKKILYSHQKCVILAKKSYVFLLRVFFTYGVLF